MAEYKPFGHHFSRLLKRYGTALCLELKGGGTHHFWGALVPLPQEKRYDEGGWALAGAMALLCEEPLPQAALHGGRIAHGGGYYAVEALTSYAGTAHLAVYSLCEQARFGR